MHVRVYIRPLIGKSNLLVYHDVYQLKIHTLIKMLLNVRMALQAESPLFLSARDCQQSMTSFCSKLYDTDVWLFTIILFSTLHLTLLTQHHNALSRFTCTLSDILQCAVSFDHFCFIHGAVCLVFLCMYARLFYYSRQDHLKRHV